MALSPEERENPMNVLGNFFSFAHLPQVRELLWKWLKATITGNYNKTLSRLERENLVHFYEQLEKLIEAVHLLHLKTRENPGT